MVFEVEVKNWVETTKRTKTLPPSYRNIVLCDGGLRWDHDGCFTHIDAICNPVDSRDGKE